MQSAVADILRALIPHDGPLAKLLDEMEIDDSVWSEELANLAGLVAELGTTKKFSGVGGRVDAGYAVFETFALLVNFGTFVRQLYHQDSSIPQGFIHGTPGHSETLVSALDASIQQALINLNLPGFESLPLVEQVWNLSASEALAQRQSRRWTGEQFTAFVAICMIRETHSIQHHTSLFESVEAINRSVDGGLEQSAIGDVSLINSSVTHAGPGLSDGRVGKVNNRHFNDECSAVSELLHFLGEKFQADLEQLDVHAMQTTDPYPSIEVVEVAEGKNKTFVNFQLMARLVAAFAGREVLPRGSDVLLFLRFGWFFTVHPNPAVPGNEPNLQMHSHTVVEKVIHGRSPSWTG